MADKTTSLAAAIQLVQDDDTLALGGMTIYRRPVAFVRALIQRNLPPQNLTLLAFTAGMASDMLVGAGLVRRTRTCYFGLESFGLAPMFTRAVTAGDVAVIEESEASIANGLRAQMARVGFMPSRAWLGTDMFKARPDVKTIYDPYTGETVTAFPAITCDVAVIHVLKADKEGNCVLGGNPTIDMELAIVADRVILTAEEVVDVLPAPIDIPGMTVTAVVHAPRGAWPASCYPAYPLDGEEILRYIAACNEGEFEAYVYEDNILD
ncbi:MAG: CoA transferase subunit A [Anaerolineae bacterium]